MKTMPYPDLSARNGIELAEVSARVLVEVRARIRAGVDQLLVEPGKKLNLLSARAGVGFAGLRMNQRGLRGGTASPAHQQEYPQSTESIHSIRLQRQSE